MTNPIDDPGRCFRVELAGGGSVYGEHEFPVTAGEPAPVVTIRLPAPRAHALAHLMQEWVSTFRLVPDRTDEPSAYLLGRAIEDAAAALGELGALACATRSRGSVSAEQRLAAVGVLRVAEPAMSPVGRIALVDSAAGWMDQDSGGELALALLRAACSSELVASRAYVELITPVPDQVAGVGTKREDER